jgi:hypothetical protein
MATKSLSYKSVVCDEISDFQSNEQNDDVLKFCDWDTTLIQMNACQNTTVQPKRDTNNAKQTFLQDFANFITELTLDIKDYYGFHGLANELSVNNITDSFETSISIEILDENSTNDISSDDDDTFS